MTILTVELLTDSIMDEGWASLAGAVSCALYNVGDAPDGTLDRALLTEVIHRLPGNIRYEAFRLGFDNDLVSHNVVSFLQSRFDELGSLDAFLASPEVQP